MEEIPSSLPARVQLMVRELLLPAWMPLSFPSSQSPKGGSAIVSNSAILSNPALSWLGQYLPSNTSQDPATLFHTLLVSLVSLTVFVRILQFQLKTPKASSTKKVTISSPHRKRSSIRSSFCRHSALRGLQWKFLSVFWLLRTSFWMSGPYFYAAYASRTNGNASLISQISLAGYAAIALLGPFLGKFTDKYGRKVGTLVATLLYGTGSLSVMANPLWALFAGRALGGVGTSLLSAAPEAWLVSAFQSESVENPSFLQQTFGMAYAYDPVCAIAAGQLAGFAASYLGPTGPFQMSPIFLAMGALLAALFWEENRAGVVSSAVVEGSPKRMTPSSSKEEEDMGMTTSDDDSDSSDSESEQPAPQSATIWDALKVIQQDRKILLLGGVQSFFEGAMYIFVMQWPPTINRAIQQAFGKRAITPYGTAFSCFMACCMAGSTVFGILARRNKDKCNKERGSCLSFEKQTVALLALACMAMVGGASAVSQGNELWQLISAYFVFEACVGMYFPSIGTLRSKYLPDAYRSLIMTLFGVPLNIIVVTVFLLVHKLGDAGALAVAAVALGLATACMVGLFIIEKRKKAEEQKKRKYLRNRFKQLVRKVQLVRNVSDRCRERMLREATEERRNTFSTFSGPQFF